jgi:MFS transporter, DHA2 family, lincomycin resistance protein
MTDFASPPGASKPIDSDRLSKETIIAIAVLVASSFTVILNEMLMAVALPRVMGDLEVTASTAQWLTTGYMLTMAVVIPITGYLTERFRVRTVYTLAMSLFVLGTIIAASAPDFSLLLVGRIVQAIGTAIVAPLAFTVVTTLVPPSRTGRMLALLTISTSIAPSVGPIVAGSILSVASWRWLFIVILPIGLISLIVGNLMIRVPSTPRAAKLDLLSVVLSALGFASLVYGLASLGEGAEHALVSPWLVLAIGVVVVALFVGRQLHLQKSDRAQLDLRPFLSRTFSASALLAVLFMTAAFGMSTLLPVVLQTSYDLSTFQAGLFMAPGGITIAVVSTIVGRYYDRVGPRPLMITGAIIDAAALWFLSTLGLGTPVWLLLVTFIVIIVGQAFMWTPVFAASLGSLDKHLLPHGSAIINTIQQLAGAAGIAIMFSITTAASANYVAAGESTGLALAHGAQQAFAVGSLFVLLALVVALFVPRKVASNGMPVAAH